LEGHYTLSDYSYYELYEEEDEEELVEEANTRNISEKIFQNEDILNSPLMNCLLEIEKLPK
jgi:hypothetical protein